jgi:putative intracellular protease/amidase
MPFLLETELRKRDVTFHASENWTSTSVIDGRLVTGQNPQSGHAVAENILKVAATLK